MRTDLTTGSRVLDPAPQFLYRGEAEWFPSTEPTIVRLRRRSDLPVSEIEDLIRALASRIVRRLAPINPDLARRYPTGSHRSRDVLVHALMQHYGLPMELIDFTSDLNVAAMFASGGRSRGRGCIGVLDMDLAKDLVCIVRFPRAEGAERLASISSAP